MMIITKRARFMTVLLTAIGFMLHAEPDYRRWFGQPAEAFDPNNRHTSYPYISSDTFRAFCDHIIDETNVPFDPHAVKDGDLIYVRGYPICLNEFIKYLPLINHRFILITHNTDETLPGPYEFLLNHPHIAAWFTQNKGSNHPKLHALPIGIANRYWEYGDPDTLTEILTMPRKTNMQHFLYINFNAKNNPHMRGYPLEYFKEMSFCSFSEPKPWNEYLLDLTVSQFVLSPPGNGLDCYRAWEALLCGAIPVMLSTSIDCLFDDLPVVIIHDWKEVSREFLEKQYQAIQKKTYNFNKLYVGFWIDYIRAIQTKIRNTQQS